MLGGVKQRRMHVRLEQVSRSVGEPGGPGRGLTVKMKRIRGCGQGGILALAGIQGGQMQEDGPVAQMLVLGLLASRCG